MSNYCMIEVAFGKEKEVEEAVQELLRKQLVSGCQVIQSQSSWHWHHKMESEMEYLLFMKTKKSLLKEIYQVIRSIHTYDCFEFAVFDLTSISEEYLDYIEQETK